MIKNIDLFLKKTFHGHFIFERHVKVLKDVVHGRAAFTAMHEGLIYFREEGQYQLQGERQTFYQERYFKFHTDGFSILKRDMSPLHHFQYEDKDRGVFRHTHYCGADVYNLKLEVESANMMRMSYDVMSPTDPYSLCTVYTRIK